MNTPEYTTEPVFPMAETLAAMFTDRARASDALIELHHAGFRDVWLGVVQGDAAAGPDSIVASEADGGEEQTLHHALIAHGLMHDQARQLEAKTSGGAAIVTVNAENDRNTALAILRDKGGIVEATSPDTHATPDLDDALHLQLREERLLVDKQRVASGEARIRKEVVSEQQSVDVPVFHEELFIRRREISEGGAIATTPIGEQREEIRIPLSEERVNVQKRTIVTEQIAVGKRMVVGTERVSDTVRHEELRVDDDGRHAANDD